MLTADLRKRAGGARNVEVPLGFSVFVGTQEQSAGGTGLVL